MMRACGGKNCAVEKGAEKSWVEKTEQKKADLKPVKFDFGSVTQEDIATLSELYRAPYNAMFKAIGGDGTILTQKMIFNQRLSLLNLTIENCDTKMLQKAEKLLSSNGIVFEKKEVEVTYVIDPKNGQYMEKPALTFFNITDYDSIRKLAVAGLNFNEADKIREQENQLQAGSKDTGWVK